MGLARSERFELPTLGIEIRCSIQLSYERVRIWISELLLRFYVEASGGVIENGLPSRRPFMPRFQKQGCSRRSWPA